MKQLGRLRLYQFAETVVKIDGYIAIMIGSAIFALGIMIGLFIACLIYRGTI